MKQIFLPGILLFPLFLFPSHGQLLDPLDDTKEPRVHLAFNETPLETVLDLYGELTGKSIMTSPALKNVNVTFKSREKLTSREALFAIETLLSMHQIGLLPFQDKFVRVERIEDLIKEPLPIENLKLDIPAPRPPNRTTRMPHNAPVLYPVSYNSNISPSKRCGHGSKS